MAKDIKFNEEARTSIKKGIDKLAEAVKMTLGPRGRAAVIEKSYGAPQVTFDGVTVAKEIELEDRFENLGADFIKQAADKTNDNVGDGTTTSVVLAQALIEQGEEEIRRQGFNVIQLSEEIQKSAQLIVSKLEAQKEVINDSQKIKEVATLSAKNKEIGSLISEVMEKVGKEGVVTIDDSNTISNSYEVVEGMQMNKGYISPYMVTDPERMEAVLEDPYVLVTDKKISSIKEILPILEKVVESGKKEIVIISEDLDGEALATLVVNKLRGTFNVLGVKAPGFGDRKKELLEDIAIVTGANFIAEDLGKKLESLELTDLGRTKKVISTKDSTTIVDGKGDKAAIEARVSLIKNQIKTADSSFDKEKLQERVGKLSGGVAVIKVGAATETAQKELKDRVEDAVSATRAAMEEGIVPGGGIALFNLVEDAKNLSGETNVSQAVNKIIIEALKAPIIALINNSGENANSIISKLETDKKKGKDIWLGFNVNTKKIEDLKEAGIIDPLKVTKSAFLNAISVASNYLVMGVSMTEIPKPEASMPPAGMGGGMPMGM